MTARQYVNTPPPMTEREWQRTVVHAAERLGWALKRENGTLSPAQEERIASLRAAGNTVFVWRPSDWDDVIAELER